jgi:hypothetical protein
MKDTSRESKLERHKDKDKKWKHRKENIGKDKYKVKQNRKRYNIKGRDK